MTHYVFSFKNDNVRNATSSWNFNRNKSRLGKTEGVFQLRYLNSKIKKENYSLESVTASKINTLLRELGLHNHDYYGYHIITTSDEHSLYLRLGIEDIIHPKGNCQFTRGYKFTNHEEIYDNLVSMKQEILNLSNEETEIRDQIRGLSISRYEETYVAKMENIAKRIQYNDPNRTSDLAKVGEDLMNNYRLIHKEAYNEVSKLEKILSSKSDTKNQKINDISNYLDSFRMPI